MKLIKSVSYHIFKLICLSGRFVFLTAAIELEKLKTQISNLWT